MELDSWEPLKKLAKNIEFELDAKISLFTSILALISPPTFPSSNEPFSTSFSPFHSRDPALFTTASIPEKIARADALLIEIEQKIQKLSSIISNMSSAFDAPSSTFVEQHLQRHNALLKNYSQEFNRLQVCHRPIKYALT
jgi:hypothetical protein